MNNGVPIMDDKMQRTNADKTRAMSDEELAGLLGKTCEVICANLIECDGKCEEHALEWLKEEANDV